MSLGRDGGGVTRMDVRTANMKQLEDSATQLLMLWAQDPQQFMNSLGMGAVGQPPGLTGWQSNPFAQAAQQPGIMQMLYGAGAPTLNFNGPLPPSGIQPGAAPAWTPPPAASSITNAASHKGGVKGRR